MSDNTALVTQAAQAAAELVLASFGNGVAAHTGGDWGRHNAVRVYNQEFADDAGHTCAVYSLRMLLTDTSGDRAVITPIIAYGAAFTPGSAPQIVVQPTDITVGVGDQLTLITVAISEVPMTYQWYKDDEAVSGATANFYLNTGVVKADQATYYCVITNQYGSVTSAEAYVTVEE